MHPINLPEIGKAIMEGKASVKVDKPGVMGAARKITLSLPAKGNKTMEVSKQQAILALKTQEGIKNDTDARKFLAKLEAESTTDKRTSVATDSVLHDGTLPKVAPRKKERPPPPQGRIRAGHGTYSPNKADITKPYDIAGEVNDLLKGKNLKVESIRTTADAIIFEISKNTSYIFKINLEDKIKNEDKAQAIKQMKFLFEIAEGEVVTSPNKADLKNPIDMGFEVLQNLAGKDVNVKSIKASDEEIIFGLTDNSSYVFKLNPGESNKEIASAIETLKKGLNIIN